MAKRKAKKKSPSPSSHSPPPRQAPSHKNVILGLPSPTKKHSRHSSLPPTARSAALDLPPLHHTPHVPLVLDSQPPSKENPIPNNPPSSPHLSSPSVELSSAEETKADDSSSCDSDSSSHYGSPSLNCAEHKARQPSPASSARAASEGPASPPSVVDIPGKSAVLENVSVLVEDIPATVVHDKISKGPVQVSRSQPLDGNVSVRDGIDDLLKDPMLAEASTRVQVA
ncbi:hypothetical protein OIU77_015109 [Salix suchowensis]|uniref:Uncharacterized protein n=1 Tax=Salix suchowensis TaxID=1278906 RepID=A0ABQ8ZSD2_9ROSI|nr:hypothetical protein OIU77_015109 [Salix suchowensis]